MTNIQGSVQACPPRHARGTHKPLSSAQSRAQECESPLAPTGQNEPMPANPPPVSFAERVCAATAPDRDRFIDAVRAGSLLIVVLGHWLMATVVVPVSYTHLTLPT